MEPSIEQLKTFYQVIREAVLLSSYVAFVELSADKYLFVHVGRYDSSQARIVVVITPDGRSSIHE
jgi:hypothetical protein